MTNIDDLLEKVKGDKLDAAEFVRLATAVKENQELCTSLGNNKVGYVIRTTDEGIYARFFKDKTSADAYILNPEDPDNQPICSIPLPSGGGGETVYEVNLFSNSSLSIASSNRNISILLAFTTQSYVASTDTWRDNAEDGIVTISRKVGDGAWEVVKILPNFTRTLYADRNTNQRSIDLSDCLVNGDQQIMVGATGTRTLASAVELIFDISVAEMIIQNTTNWQEPKIYNPIVAASSNISINYKIIGAVDKSLYYKVYDPNNNLIESNAVNVGTWSDTESNYLLTIAHPLSNSSMAAPGVIKVEAWLQSNSATPVQTEHIFINVLVTSISSEAVLLVVNNLSTPIINWTSRIILEWAVYNKTSLVGTDVRFVIQNNDGSSIWVDNTVSGAENNTVYTFAPYVSIELPDVTFDGVIKAYIDNTEVYSKAISIDNSNSFAPTANANFILLPSMRSNADSNKRTIINETQLTTEPTEITATWNNVVFEKDGWTTDNNNVKILKLFANSSVEIDYSPYTQYTVGSGLTMEFDIKCSNISDEDEPILKIGHYNEQEQFVGLMVYPKAAYMYSNLKQSKYFQDIEWGEDERVHITFNIMPGLQVYRGSLNLCRSYINGGIENEFEYDPNTDSFGLSTDKLIIGGNGADISIYGIRFYKDRQLSSDQILNDYIASLSDVQEKLRLISANNIKDAGVISYELAKTKYNTLVWHGDYASFEHPGKFTGDLDINIIGDPDHSGTITNLQESGQGTSAKTYYKWNGTFKHTSSSVWTDGNGVVKGNYYQLTNSSPKMNKEVGKINYASSPQSHKAGACEMFNVLHTAVCGLTGVQRTVQARNVAAGKSDTAEMPRVAIEEKPFLFFVQTANDTAPKFYGLMTWGSPKGDAATFGYDETAGSSLSDYLMIEGSDHEPKLTLNQTPWFADEVPYNASEEAYMWNGKPSWDYDLGNQDSLHKLYDAFNFVYKYGTRIEMWNGSVINLKNSQGTNPDGSNYADRTYQYIIINSSVSSENYTVHRFDFPSSEWVNAGITKTGGQYDEYNVDTDLDLGLAGQTIAPSEALATIKAARIAMFREHASDYFNVQDMLFLMQFLKLIGASDNRAKNTYLYYDPVDDCVRSAQDDLDTILMFNNQGQKQKFYWVEEHDTDTRPDFSRTFWAGGENNMYNTFEDAYREELETTMRNIFTAIINDAGSPMGFFNKYFFNIQEYIPTVAYNETARLFYEEAIFASSKGTDTDPLTQSRGKQLSAEREWVKNRIVYIASYCSYYDATGSSIVFRQDTSSQYNEKPAMKLYMFRRNGVGITGPDGYDRRSNSSIYSQRTDKGVTRQFTVTSTDTMQTTTELAEYLLDIGDLSEASVSGTVDFSAGKRLTKIKAGAATTPNFHPSVISGLPINLQEIDIRNISSLTSIPSLENMAKLTKLLAEGTSLTGVILPQTNNLTDLTLPSTLTSLTLRNQINLYDNHFSYTPTYLKSLTIGNVGIDVQSFVFDWLTILKTKTLDNEYTLIADGINWIEVDADDLVDLMAIPNIVLKGTISLDANSITAAQLAIVNGKLGTLIATGDLVLNYTNVISIGLSTSLITGGDNTSTANLTISSLDIKNLTLQYSITGETWTNLDPEHPTEYLQITNYRTEIISGCRYVYGTLIAPNEVETNVQYRLRATDGTKNSTTYYFTIVRKNRITGATISGTKYLTQTEHDYAFNVAITPANASEIPTYSWIIESVYDTDTYEVQTGQAASLVVRRMDQVVMATLPNNNSASVNLTTGTELMTAKNNNTSFTIKCIVTGSYQSEVEATYEVIGHEMFTPRAAQSYDPEEENYNPALIMILKDNETTTGVDLHEQIFTDGSRGFYLTQAEAATIPYSAATIFNNVTQLQDTNGYVVESYEDGVLDPNSYYRFEKFNEWRYFTSMVPTGNQSIDWRNSTYLLEVTLPNTIANTGVNKVRVYSPNNTNFILRMSEGVQTIPEISGTGTNSYIGLLTLYIPSTFTQQNIRCGNELRSDTVKEIHFNGTLEEWYSKNFNRDVNINRDGCSLYCKETLITSMDAASLSEHTNSAQGIGSLTTITGTITTLVNKMFVGCHNLESITLSNSITILPQYCFQRCAKLDVPLPTSLTQIKQDALSLTKTTQLILPNTVNVFEGQTTMANLTTISYPNTMTAPGGIGGATSLTSVYFRLDGASEYYITTLPQLVNIPANFKLGYGEYFYDNTAILPPSVTSNGSLKNIKSANYVMPSVTNIQFTNAYGYNTQDLLSAKSATTINWTMQNNQLTFFYLKDVITFSISDGAGNQARLKNFFLNASYPPTATNVPPAVTVYKILIPTGTMALYLAASKWSTLSTKYIEYNYTLDRCGITTALRAVDVVTTAIPVSSCSISITSGTATITCTDSTIESAIPIKLHYRINNGSWSSPVNSGSTFSVSANDVIEVYATHDLRGPSNMLKATWDGTDITYDYTNIYIDPNNLPS